MILVDSNIWAYYLDAGCKEHKRVAAQLPRLLGDQELLMPSVVQLELVHYLVKRLGSQSGPALDAFLGQAAEIVPLSGGLVVEAARLLQAHRDSGIGGRDCVLLVAAKRHEATLFTNDKALARAAAKLDVPVVNPAAP